MTDRKSDWWIGHQGKNRVQSELWLDCPACDRSNWPIKNSILCGHRVIQSHQLAASIDQSSIWDSLRFNLTHWLGLQSPSLNGRWPSGDPPPQKATAVVSANLHVPTNLCSLIITVTDLHQFLIFRLIEICINFNLFILHLHCQCRRCMLLNSTIRLLRTWKNALHEESFEDSIIFLWKKHNNTQVSGANNIQCTFK